MGRTNPTYRGILESLRERWSGYRRALRFEHQESYDRLWEHAQEFADAAGYLNHDAPMVPVLFSICLKQEERIEDLEAQVQSLEQHMADLDDRDGDDGQS